ncbi:hypothetical protein TNCV_2615901 [Trichonephila clavipes]|nr:hypothetical protein TNCV_2615901 [Trichonephila clavipes]
MTHYSEGLRSNIVRRSRDLGADIPSNHCAGMSGLDISIKGKGTLLDNECRMKPQIDEIVTINEMGLRELNTDSNGT